MVIADAVGPSLQRKGDLLANQDTCLSALRGEMLPQFDHILYNSLVTFIGLLVLCKAGVITQIFFFVLHSTETNHTDQWYTAER